MDSIGMYNFFVTTAGHVDPEKKNAILIDNSFSIINHI